MTKDSIEQLPEILKKHICTLKKASLDEEHHESMCESQLTVVDFDRIPQEYARGKGWRCVPKSNDALYIDKSDMWYFVEFKNGKINGSDVYRKIYDSFLMLMDLGIISGFDFLRKQVCYILVYNSDKNGPVPASENLEKIYSYTLRQAETEAGLFGIWKLEQYLFRETHTYTRELFEEKFIQPMEQAEAS